MREPRAFAELETKIGQEDNPAQKLVDELVFPDGLPF